MTVQVSVKTDIAEATRWMTKLERQKIPKVTKQALNNTGFAGRKLAMRQIRQKFQRPVRRTQRAPLVRMATARDLSVELYINDDPKSGTAPNKYLQPQIDGGRRRPKKYEKALRLRGIIKPNQYSIINENYRTKAGNISGQRVEQILSQLGAAEMTAGYQANQTARSKRRAGKSRKQYFPLYRDGRAIGIFVRATKKRVDNVMGFDDSAPRYRQRWDFYDESERYMVKKFGKELTRLVRNLMALER